MLLKQGQIPNDVARTSDKIEINGEGIRDARVEMVYK